MRRTIDLRRLGRVGRRSRPSVNLPFFPDYRGTNAYQAMLFEDLPRHGIEPQPLSVRGLSDALRERATWTDPGVVNLQWTSLLLQPAADEAEARRRLASLLGLLDGFLSAGGRLIWTIHNVLPHELRHREEEVALHRFLAARATHVHVLSPATVEAVQHLYPLDPDRVRLIPISSYLGWYPDTVTRDEARRALDIDPADTVLTTVGGIRPYKGHARLLDWFSSVADEDPHLRLLVAGIVEDPASSGPVLERLDHPGITARLEFVPDDEIQLWYRSADLAVLPYSSILNSSAVWLAMTFGVPVVAPRLGALVELEELPFVRLFDASDPEDLGRVVTAARHELVDADRPERWREQILAHAAQHSPRHMAEQFSALVLEAAAAGPGRGRRLRARA